MPGLARKLLICAAVDGLVIQPLATKGQRPGQPVKVRYGSAALSPVSRDQVGGIAGPNSAFEAYGIVGVFTVARLSYLITITGREEVAQVRGFPVYAITDVAVTPCTNQSEADSAVRQTAIQLRRRLPRKATTDDTDSDSDVASTSGSSGAQDDTGIMSERGSIDDGTLSPPPGEETSSGRTSIAEDVIKRRGSYGRFAQRWFSQSGWMMDQKRTPSLSGVAENDDAKQKDARVTDEVLSKTVKSEAPETPPVPTTGESLMPKLLRMAHIWFGTSKSFFFSYDVDITRSIASGGLNTTEPGQPLHKQADPLFFWNKHLLRPFSTLNDDCLLLPLMQGFVGQRTFIVDRDPPQVDSQQGSLEMDELAYPRPDPATVDAAAHRDSVDLRPSEKKFVTTVISRRSTKRAGLRYLRRGIDDEGWTANTVETEQILAPSSWDSSSNIYSFIQARGSIPLFFTQSPYSLKPLPELQHSADTNYRAFKKHFDAMGGKYGSLQLVNLIEQKNVEATVGKEYEKLCTRYNKESKDSGKPHPLEFEWFDFHAACRGMKFENVSLLLDKLSGKIESMGSTVEVNAKIDQNQSGVLRTNCMDCLDRTNVCHSSFAKFMLDSQLKKEGFDMSAQLDQDNTWFNTLWADNGDAISKQYASTAAMKGDYTRTKRRDYRGMVNDLGLSLTRFYNGMVNDHFSQAAIDFFLGNVTSLVFDEFEADMMTKDPSMSMPKMRERAIETSQKIAIEDDREDFIGGWTLLSPHEAGSIRSLPFEEVVLLLTDAALYLCRFDWKLDKVSSFERVDLSHVSNIRVGTYITSTISPAQADEMKNLGLVITYEPGRFDIVRTNTRSLSSISETPAATPAPTQEELSQLPKILSQGIFGSGTSAQTQKRQPPRKIALKALYSHTSLSDARGVKRMTEEEQVNSIASELERMVFKSQPTSSHPEGDDKPAAERKSIVEKGDIISLAEAKRSTGLFEQLGHSIKKLVWAS